MDFDTPRLPYPVDGLEPHLRAETVEKHFREHHVASFERLRRRIDGTPEAELTLVELVRSASGETFRLAVEVWNHGFYWRSLHPRGGGVPSTVVLDELVASFGSYAEFRHCFAHAATGEFGVGWVWLVVNQAGRFVLLWDSEAVHPLRRDVTPLLTLDVTDHAYGPDFEDRPERYVDVFLDHLVNWSFVAANHTFSPAVYPPPALEDPAVQTASSVEPKRCGSAAAER